MDERLMLQLDGMRRVPGYEPPKHTVDAISQYQYDKFGPWRFNEIIGHIRLYVLGSQVRGEYFSAEKQRNLLGRSKVFVFRSPKLAPEVEIERGTGALTNQQIWDALQKYISRCQRELRKGRVIDDNLLKSIGPFVDWLTVLDRLKSRS
jgi:hypothetical protein